ncbi:MAG: AsmA family protein [Candidatus Firestonebacteria bacterium]
MKKFLKILGILTGCFVVLVIVLTIVVTFLIPWDKVKEAMVVETSKVLKREVKVEKIKFSLFKGIEFKNFYIGNKEGFSQGAFVSADSAVAQYKFWALFKKQIILTKIELVNPHILIEKDKSGNFNFSDFIPTPSKTLPAKPEKVEKVEIKLPVELSISKLALNNGEVIYNDFSQTPVFNLELKKINVLVSDISLETQKPFDFKAEASLSYKKTPIDFSTSGRIEMKFKEQKIFIKDISLKLAGIVAKGNVELSKFMEEPSFKAELNVKLESGKLIKMAEPFLSTKMLAYTKDLSISGDIPLSLLVKGSVGKIIHTTGEGSLDLSKVEAKYSTVFVKSKNFNMDLKYKFNFDGAKLLLDSDIFTADSKIKAVAEVGEFKNPKINISVDTDTSISEIFSMLPVMENFESTGKINLISTVKLNLPKDYSVDYNSIKIHGKGNIRDFGIKHRKFNFGVSKLVSDISLTEKDLELNKISFYTGNSVFNGTVSVSNFDLENISEWKEHFKGEAKINLTSQKFVIDEIMDAMPKKENKKVEISLKQVKDEDLGFKDEEIKEITRYISKDLKISGKLSINEMVYKKLKLNDLKSEIKLENRTGNIFTTTNLYNGTIKNNFKLDLNTPGLAYETSAEAVNLNIGNFLNSVYDSFFEKQTTDIVKDKIMGITQANFNIKGKGANKKDIKKNLEGNLNYKIINGKIKNWKILKEAFTALKINPTEEIPFREFYGKLKIGGQKVRFEEFKIMCDDARYSVSGDVCFDKDLGSDLKLKMFNDFAPQLVSKLGDISAYASDENGWMPIDLEINGTIKSPGFAPLMERSLKNLESKLKKKAEEELNKKGEELKKKGEDLLKGLFKR